MVWAVILKSIRMPALVLVFFEMLCYYWAIRVLLGRICPGINNLMSYLLIEIDTALKGRKKAT